jgi:hypothetical protein
MVFVLVPAFFSWQGNIGTERPARSENGSRRIPERPAQAEKDSGGIFYSQKRNIGTDLGGRGPDGFFILRSFVGRII